MGSYSCRDLFIIVNTLDYSLEKKPIWLRSEMTKPFLRPWPPVTAKKGDKLKLTTITEQFCQKYLYKNEINYLR